MNPNPPSNLGATGAEPFFHLPLLPTIAVEWAALIPLVVHLASFQDDYHMIGELTLRCRLIPGLFPKLGQLQSISKLLCGGSAFLDRVSSKSTHGSTVWDVSWGSVFPCANGAARDFLMDQALRHSLETIKVDEWTTRNTSLDANSSSKRTSSDISKETVCINETEKSANTPAPAVKITESTFARPQTLRIIYLYQKEAAIDTQRYLSWSVWSLLVDISWVLVLLGLVIILCLAGAYGTASIVLSGITSRIFCRYLCIQRPKGYLQNNETHDACMLTAIHENASVWVLYRGDRSIVDWLLNKTMITAPQPSSAMYYYFRLAHYHQLLAMTYVAAQKGWDGFCLLSLMILVWITRALLDRTSPAAEWTKTEGVAFRTRSFEFSGRTPMIGAVQMLSDSRIVPGRMGNFHRNTTWMDSILAPCKRRQSWTDGLLSITTQKNVLPNASHSLDQSDQNWVERMTKLSVEAVKCIESNMVEMVSCMV